METIVQFLSPGDTFLSRGVLHTIRTVERRGLEREVFISGKRADEETFEATFGWGETLDTCEHTLTADRDSSGTLIVNGAWPVA